MNWAREGGQVSVGHTEKAPKGERLQAPGERRGTELGMDPEPPSPVLPRDQKGQDTWIWVSLNEVLWGHAGIDGIRGLGLWVGE